MKIRFGSRICDTRSHVCIDQPSEYCFNVTVRVGELERGVIVSGSYFTTRFLPSGLWRGIKSQREMIYSAITRRRHPPPLAASPASSTSSRTSLKHNADCFSAVSITLEYNSSTTPRTRPVFSGCGIHYFATPLINSRFQIAKN